MRWQDAVISVGSVVFAVALWPTLRGQSKPALSSSIITGTILYVYSIVYISLHLWFSLVTGLLTATCWSILAIQRYRQLRGLHRDPELHVEDEIQLDQ